MDNVLMFRDTKKINHFTDIKNQNAIYFSRSTIPFIRNKKVSANKYPTEINPFQGLIGISGYKNEFSQLFSNLKEGVLKGLKELEQLRVLENGIKRFYYR